MTQYTGSTAVQLFEAIDGAMEKAQGGRYRAFNLVEALNAVGLDVRPIAMVDPLPEQPTHTNGAAERV